MHPTRSVRRGTASLLAAVAGLLIGGCAGMSDFTGPTPVDAGIGSVEIAPREVTLSPGGTLALQLSTRDETGRLVTDRPARWSSSDSLVVRVTDAGVLTALEVGRVQVAVSVAGRSATTQVTVVARPVASLEVTPGAPQLLVGGAVQLSAVPRDETGTALPDRLVVWQSSDPAVATVDATGFVSALAAGLTTITATSEGRVASVGVVVRPVPVAAVEVAPSRDTIVVGQSTQLTAVARDAIGVPLADRAIVWTTSDPTVATVSAAGLVLAMGPGIARIGAESEGRSGVATIVVQPRPVGAVIVSPGQGSLTVGQFLALLVQVTDGSGNLLSGRPLSFTSSNPGVASVSALGEVRGVAEGSATITVESEGKSGTMTVAVRPTPVASVRIVPSEATLRIGESRTLRAEPLDGAGTPLPARSTTWRSGAPTVVSVSATGEVRALGPGTALVFAVVDGQLATATITVLAVPVASVEVTPLLSTLVVGATLDLTATARDASGAPLAGRTVTWSSSDPTVAVVSSAGRVRAVRIGPVRIDATVEGVTGSLTLTVLPPPVATVSVLLGAPTIAVGGTTQATATTRDLGGNVLTGRPVTWTSSNPSVATVSGSGLVTAVSVGTATIIASSEGISGSAAVTVSPAPVASVQVTLGASSLVAGGATTTATAVTRDAAGNALSGRTVVWTSSNEGVATVNASGLVTSVATGTTTITGTSEGVSGAATLQVTPAPVATVAVTLAASTVTAGGTTTATAVLRDARGNVLTGRAVAWSSGDESVATVSASGLVTAVRVGTTTITATSEGVSGDAGVTVSAAPPAPVASITLSAPDLSLVQYDTVQVTAVLRDAANNVLTGRTITWSTSNASVATVSSIGRVAAVGVGSATITATSEGVAETLSFTVAAAPVAVVDAVLASTSLRVGETTTATATLRDARGNVLTGRTVTWTSSNETVATVNTSGVVTAVRSGSATITATSEGVSDGVSVSVSAAPPAPVASITLNAPDSSLVQFDTVQVTAVLRDADDNELTGRTITWSTSNASVATVSSTGRVAATGVGSATITAASEGVTETITFTVAPAPVANVSVTFADSTLTVGGSTTASAELRDARGNVVTGRTVTWTSSTESVATVNASGVVTAVGDGTTTITATSEGVSGGTQITVNAPAPAPVARIELNAPDSSLIQFDTVLVTATPFDADDNELTGRTIAWSTSNASVATVSSTGRVAATGVGSATITAESEGVTETIAFTVAPAPVANVSVTFADSTLTVGGTTTASAELRDARGNVLTGRTVTWTSSTESVATVNASGVVTAVGDGTTTITATSEGVSGGTQITVNAPAPAPVARITLNAPDSSLVQFDTVLVTATLFDADDNELTGRTIAWSTSNASVATVSSTGRVAATGVGTATITAESEGVTQTIAFTVAPAPVDTVIVTLASDTLDAATTTTANAELRDARGNVLTGRTVTWSSGNDAVATVNPTTGLVTAVAPGTVSIIATSEGVSGTAALVVVTPPPLVVGSVTLTTPDSSLVQGDTVQVTVVLRDAGGALITDRAITFATSNPLIATVSDSGRVIAVGVGTVTITATSEGVDGTLVLVITEPPVASVTVTLAQSTIVRGATTQATAVLRDARGSVITGRTVSWTSPGNVARITSAGVVTGERVGTARVIATVDAVSGETIITVIAP